MRIELWGTFPGLDRLCDVFSRFDKDVKRRRLDPLVVSAADDARSTAPVATPERFELVEAIFLEQRVPIVTFDCAHPEPTALRVVQAMWRTLREGFAFCTFALQPRAVGGRDFDLLFAPASSRSRFANWTGRRIEGQTSVASEPRHRWSKSLAASIFEAPRPSLVADDPLGILTGDLQGDSSRLRLALLWNDLRDRETESPTAVLGMLDVLASMGFQERDLARRADPLIRHAAERAGREMRAGEGLRFLALLSGKIPPTRPHGRTLHTMQHAAFLLASSDPDVAIGAVPFDAGSFLATRTIERGIGDALAELTQRGRLFNLLTAAPHDAVSHLLDASKLLCRAVVLEADDAPPSWWPALRAVLGLTDPTFRRRLRRKLLPLISKPAHVCLIEPLLSGTTIGEATDCIASLWRSMAAGRDSAFEHALADVLLPVYREATRDAILDLSDEVSFPEHLLLRALQGTTDDLSLLLANERVPAALLPPLLGRFLQARTDGELAGIARDRPELLERVVTRLAQQGALPQAPAQIARVLRTVRLPAAVVINVTATIAEALDQTEATQLIAAVLPGLLISCPIEELHGVASLLQSPAVIDASTRIGSARLLDCFVPSNRRVFDGQRQSAALQLIEDAPHQIRHVLIERTEELARRLSSRDGDELSPVAFAAWAHLVEEAAEDQPKKALRSAAISLHYTFDRRPRGGSILVRRAFPLVYAVASSDDDSPDLEGLFSFLDWDRGKALRKKLVATYTHTDWAPGDLMLIAERSDIGRKILNRVAREWKGEQYIDKMKADLATSTDRWAHAAYQSILDFERNPPSRYEWD